MATTLVLFNNVKTLNNVVMNDIIKNFMRRTKNTYTIGNSKSMMKFYTDCIAAILDSLSNHKWHSTSDVKKALANGGIDSSSKLEVIISENLDNMKKEYFDTSIFKFKLTNLQKKGKAYVKKYGAGIAANIPIEADANADRWIVVRPKFGNHEPKRYLLHGTTNNTHEMTMIKLAYHYETGTKYFETRPILYSTWVNLPVERQLATCAVDTSDM